MYRRLRAVAFMMQATTISSETKIRRLREIGVMAVLCGAVIGYSLLPPPKYSGAEALLHFTIRPFAFLAFIVVFLIVAAYPAELFDKGERSPILEKLFAYMPWVYMLSVVIAAASGCLYLSYGTLSSYSIFIIVAAFIWSCPREFGALTGVANLTTSLMSLVIWWTHSNRDVLFFAVYGAWLGFVGLATWLRSIRGNNLQ